MGYGRSCPYGCEEGEPQVCHNYVRRGRCDRPYCRFSHVTPSAHTEPYPPSAPTEPDPEPPGSSTSSVAMHGRYSVTLVSAGWNQEGCIFLTDWMPAVDFTQLAHRVDLVFDATEHLKWWGTDPEAQKQFMDLYPACEQYFVALEPYIRAVSYTHLTLPTTPYV